MVAHQLAARGLAISPMAAVQHPVLQAWLAMDALCQRASAGNMSVLHNEIIDKSTLEANYEMLGVLIKHVGGLEQLSCLPVSSLQTTHMRVFELLHMLEGLRPSINTIEHLVDRFLFACRPRGRPNHNSALTLHLKPPL